MIMRTILVRLPLPIFEYEMLCEISHEVRRWRTNWQIFSFLSTKIPDEIQEGLYIQMLNDTWLTSTCDDEDDVFIGYDLME